MSKTIYCQQCAKHTEHIELVNQFGTQCVICHTIHSSLDRATVEANTFTTPDGDMATLVRNDSNTVIFSVEQGKDAGYYIYDKHSGLGGVQKRN